jgi:hypothetical protein
MVCHFHNGRWTHCQEETLRNQTNLITLIIIDNETDKAGTHDITVYVTNFMLHTARVIKLWTTCKRTV